MTGAEKLRLASEMEQWRADDAVEPLSALLRDPEPEVAERAAVSLGKLRDLRAVPALSELLRSGFPLRRPWLQVLAGIGLVAGLLLVAGLGSYLILAPGGLVLALNVLKMIEPFCRRLSERRARTKLNRAIVGALASIAAESPAPQLRSLLPDLRALSMDAVLQDGETREKSRLTAARIRELTESLKGLPVPAAACIHDPALPRIRSESNDGLSAAG